MSICRKWFLFIIFAFLSTSCEVDNPTDHTPTEQPYSVIRKWYIDSDDDRYYYDFQSNGSLYYRYFQNIGSPTSGLNGFVTKIGTWTYRIDDHTSFSVGWDDSVACYYDIVEENSGELIVKKNPDGPAGRGLGSITVLLKSAKTVIYTVPEEITDLIGTWYYDATKNGEYLKFQADGICFYHYYQSYGGNLTGWVNIKGIWGYNPDTEILSITMNGEVSYNYTITELTPINLQIALTENSPGVYSMIYSGNQLYK